MFSTPSALLKYVCVYCTYPESVLTELVIRLQKDMRSLFLLAALYMLSCPQPAHGVYFHVLLFARSHPSI